MAKAQKEIDRLRQSQIDHAIYFMPIIRHNVLLKAAFGGTLTKAEQKEAGIMSAELAEYLVWHQEP